VRSELWEALEVAPGVEPRGLPPLSGDALLLNPGGIWAREAALVVLDPGAPDGQIFMLVRDHEWQGIVDGLPLRVRTRAGSRWDGASIPRLGRLAYDRAELGTTGSMLHDGYYRGGGIYTFGESSHILTRGTADRLFLQVMEEDGVGKFRRKTAYLAVKHWGAGAWRPQQAA
jgi:hypothetical protein